MNFGRKMMKAGVAAVAAIATLGAGGVVASTAFAGGGGGNQPGTGGDLAAVQFWQYKDDASGAWGPATSLDSVRAAMNNAGATLEGDGVTKAQAALDQARTECETGFQRRHPGEGNGDCRVVAVGAVPAVIGGNYIYNGSGAASPTGTGGWYDNWNTYVAPNTYKYADGDGWRKMRDSSLLQGWMVADQLEGNDPGYRRQIIEAKARLKDEWSKRHPETHIDAAADQLTNHVNITYTDQSPALQATLNAFNTAGVPVDLQRVEDAQAFQAAHGDDATFFVDSRLTGQWTGYDHDRIVEAVMCAPVNGVDDAASRISFLKDQGLPESSHADNKATGDEPSTISEVERTENADAAPIVETPTPVREHTKPAADERKPASGPEPETTGGGDLTTGEPDGYEEMPLDLNEPEEWNGPDPFGEYSPAMESSMNPTDQPIPDQANVSTPQILQPETNGNAR